MLYNLSTDEAETTDVAADNPDVVLGMMELAEAVRENLGEFMQRGSFQRPTGSLFPDVPVISHEKDWGTIDSARANLIVAERLKRHPNQPQQNRRRKNGK